ncbi:efflux RND transporter periplasmic adaptor subunit [Brucellaceae bacterium C25G]
MKNLNLKLGQVFLTLIMISSATVLGWHLWSFHMDAPWTRYAYIRADVIRLAPDISGTVKEVLVADNATVTKGMPLFRIDSDLFQIELREAEAAVRSTNAAAELAHNNFKRYQLLLSKEAASIHQLQQAESILHQTEAAYQSAQAAQDRAKLNLERTIVKAPASGKITNFSLRSGNYVSAGNAIGVLIEKEAIYVVGYFDETKLRKLHINDPVEINIMGEPISMLGHIDSIAAGIEENERHDSAGSLASVSPAFTWIRLAQRIPVKIAIDNIPEHVNLVAGRTATVSVGEL